MHRERVKKKNSRNKQRTIAFKLLRFKDKQNILRKAKVLKETDSFINKDYCQDSVEHRKERLEEMNLLQSKGKIVYLNYSSIVSRDKVLAPSSEAGISEYCIYFYCYFLQWIDDYNGSKFMFISKPYAWPVLNGRHFARW